MNVASLELCKELYELSGWWPDDIEVPIADEDGSVGPGFSFPCYTLGRVTIGGEVGVFDASWHKSIHGGVEAVGLRGSGETKADIPEDATCKLAIELFKQGILKKGEDHV